MSEASEVPARSCRHLKVRVRHEPCHVGEEVIVGAYVRIVPVLIRPLVTASETAAQRRGSEARVDREGVA